MEKKIETFCGNEEKRLEFLPLDLEGKKDQNASQFSRSTLSNNSLSLSLSDDEMNAKRKRRKRKEVVL